MHGDAPALTGLSGLVGGDLLLDRFGNADGTNLDGRALDIGGTWNGVSGTWQTQGNRARKTNATGANQFARANAGRADATARAKFPLPASGSWTLGLSVRISDGSNLWIAALGASGAQKVDLIEVNAGSNTVRASATASSTLANNGTYTLSAVCSGATITLLLDGVQQLSYASATLNQTVTWFGLMVYYDGATWLAQEADDFEVFP